MASALVAGSILPVEAQAPAPAAPIAATVPPPPEAVGPAKAYATLEKHCARCHQAGRLQDEIPAHNFANILNLDEIARDPSLVRPGVPDASPLYTSILSHRMPSDIYRNGQVGSEPTGEEIEALRDWIDDLPRSPPGRCKDRKRLAPEAVGETIAAAVAAVSPDEARQLRFISLVDLYNTCAGAAELEGFRQAVGLLVNSLSWSPTPVRLRTIGDEKVVLQLTLTDAGWIPAHWEQLVAAYPLSAAPSARLPQAVLDATGARTPMLPADWLADAAMRPPLYHELLGLPGRLGNLQRILHVDADADIKRSTARRAGILQSRETRSSRIVERHAAANGALQLSYDFAGANGRQSLTEHPLGPAASEAMHVPFRHDATKSIFHLPNGFVGFSQSDSRGDRIDLPPPELTKDLPSGSEPLATGLACMQCHGAGPIGVRDELRGLIESERTASRELKEAVSSLHAPESEMTALVEADAQKVRSAYASAGIDPGVPIWGLHPLAALAQAYRRRLDLSRAAADLGLDVDVLRRQLETVSGANTGTARVLRQGVVTRVAADRLLAQIASGNGDQPTPAPAQDAAKPAAAGNLELELWSDADGYDAGQVATFFAQPTQSCYLTLIDVDKAGKATVLFPNEFEQNNLVAAGVERRVPGPEAPYKFRLKDRGRETIVGICTLGQKPPDGVAHDFDRLRFTVLGDWRIFLRDPPALSEARRDDAAQSVPRAPPRRTRPRQPEPQAKPAPGADAEARAAVTVDIK